MAKTAWESENYTPSSKDELVQLLQEAAEIEHQLLCLYLFTAYTIKQNPAEGGFSDDPLTLKGEMGAALQWRGQIIGVAVQEMLHLALVNNLLAALGAKPHLQRPNFPLNQARYYPPMFRFDLRRFTPETMQWFVCYEGFARRDDCPPASCTTAHGAGEEQHFRTIGELYEVISRGLKHLDETLGPDALFSGDPSRQLSDREVTGLFNFPPATIERNGEPVDVPVLNRVTDLHSAFVAVNTIVCQGEGDIDAWQTFQKEELGIDLEDMPMINSPSHESTFESITSLLKALLSGNPGFDPSRPTLENPLRENPDDDPEVNLVTNPFTREVSDFFDGLYNCMLDLLELAFVHDGNEYEIQTLTQASIRLMSYILSPIGNLLTQLPASEKGAAGPAFHRVAGSKTWQEMQAELARLAEQAEALAAREDAPDKKVYLSPSYLSTKPMLGVVELLRDFAAPDLAFMSTRLQRVAGRKPPQDAPRHVCQGLNQCKGQDITGTAPMAGEGQCATADPHVCAGQSACAGQGGCGFTPDPNSQKTLQDHPGQNERPADGACGSPILPSTVNTFGVNAPGGAYHERTGGKVWEFARLLFEERMQAEGKPYGPHGGRPGSDG